MTNTKRWESFTPTLASTITHYRNELPVAQGNAIIARVKKECAMCTAYDRDESLVIMLRNAVIARREAIARGEQPSHRRTILDVRKELKRRGATITRTADGEYRVNVSGGSEDTAYYTTDLEDALYTGRAMTERAS